MTWIVQLQSPEDGARYLTLRGKGVTVDRSKAKIFTDKAEAERYVGIASDLWPDSKLIPITEAALPPAPSELERLKQAAQKVATALAAQLSLNGDRVHHGHRSRPGTCSNCDALSELESLITPNK